MSPIWRRGPPALVAAVAGWLAIAILIPAQPASGQPARARATQRLDATVEGGARTAQPAEPAATLVYANRAIVQFRATVLSRTPADRAEAAAQVLDRLVDETPYSRVATDTVGNARVVRLGNRTVFVILPEDVDELAGESIDEKAADAAGRLEIAFSEAVELRTPSRLLRSGVLALGATLLYVGALWLLRRGHRATAPRLARSAARQLERLNAGDIIVRASRATDIVRRAIGLVWFFLAVAATDAWLTFLLRRFPYTRPWGESLRVSIASALVSVGRAVVDALPGLFVVLIILLVTRFLVRLVVTFFEAVEHGRLSAPGIHPETASPTRRIAIALLWLFALIVSYGYLPGSDSDAFKGVSVLVGVMISLGSTGIMNQIMSGLTITYSRALRIGDFVKVGDVEGTVLHLGTLAAKIKTPHSEEVTIPNSVVVSNATTNYSRYADADGVFAPTSLTIGYDVPWRQVHALLLLAASRTCGVRSEPPSVVRQTALQEFSVRYTLLVCLKEPHLRGPVLDRLHANIQDAFNEHGVQIMSPHYETDPIAPKVVNPSRWYAAPAASKAAGDPADDREFFAT